MTLTINVLSPSEYCHWYAATLGMAVLSVLAVTLVPLGIICCVTKKYMTSQHESEAKVRRYFFHRVVLPLRMCRHAIICSFWYSLFLKNEHSFTLDQPDEFKVTSNALPSRELRLFQRNYMKKHRGHNNRYSKWVIHVVTEVSKLRLQSSITGYKTEDSASNRWQ